MGSNSDIKFAKICGKCGAQYGFDFCRDSVCPFRSARADLSSPVETAQQAGAHVIVLGNEKGGSGKSTIAMHLIVGLMKRGFSVASIDLDASQGTLSRYVQNRRVFSEASSHALSLPEHLSFYCSDAPLRRDADRENRANLGGAIDAFAGHDFIVIDTPGSTGPLSRLGLTFADSLITPLNDSFLDLDLLAQVDTEGRNILTIGQFSQSVLDERQQRKAFGQRYLNWIVLRNRLTHIDARNKRQIGRLLELLGIRLQFRSVSGFGERVVFRELFPKGLTLLDLRDEAVDAALSMSHVAARQELRALLNAVAASVEQGQSLTVNEPAIEAMNSEPVRKIGLWMTGPYRMTGRSRHVSKQGAEQTKPASTR